MLINLFIREAYWGFMAKRNAKQNPIYRIFGINPRTVEQKRFIRWFVVIKTIVYLVIFALALIFLWKFKNLGR